MRAGVTLSAEVDEEAEVPLRPRMLRVVLENLAENAIRYAGDGTRFSITLGREQGETVIVAADDGVGANEEDLRRLFERFYRADRARASRGTGLGLAIVKHIVTSAGGKVEASGGPGKASGSGSPSRPKIDAMSEAKPEAGAKEVVFGIEDLTVRYHGSPAISGVSFEIFSQQITAIIGPSGCGKSTFISCLNRMNDVISGASVDGAVLFHGQDLYGPGVDPVEVRKRIGMVFQKPNPFPKSIYDNAAYGPRVLGMAREPGRARPAGARAGGALGRGQGPAQEECAQPLRRPAAATLHRAGSRRRAGRDPHGRARLGSRSDRDHAHRGPDAHAQAGLHDRRSSRTTCSRRRASPT